ncbi:MAG: preprotein translocase subunit SecY [Verrucomicrobiota bacterium JB023]|nr:preprotein translocase subunit SecY [Verrucomicrobiota bacterium JB023]
MISAFANTWRVPELRDRILFTLAMIIIVRLGVAISIPGVDTTVIDEWLKERVTDDGGNNPGAAVGALLNVFSGGALENVGLFALGIMPYISASIMMQLMSAVVPKLAKLRREEGGQQKINQYTRILTICIAAVQGFLLMRSLENPEIIPYMEGIGEVGRELVPNFGAPFVLLGVLTIIAGTMFLMWIGDQITERGIGNGISLIITVNIIAALPGGLVQAWRTYVGGANGSPFSAMALVGLVALLIVVTAAVIAITQAQRRIAVQYAKRASNRHAKEMTGHTQYLPLKVNYAGVMPVIFASAVLQLPLLLLSQVFRGQEWVVSFQEALNPASWPYYVIAGVMIFFFSYFWVATMFQPSEIAENLKKGGGYVPGVRPGKPTADFLDFTMTRLTFFGAIFLTALFVIPGILSNAANMPSIVAQFFGGTSLLILVGVLLDMMRQIETHLLQRNYDGFLRQGKLKGRYERRQAAGQAAASSHIVFLWVFIAILCIIAGISQFF